VSIEAFAVAQWWASATTSFDKLFEASSDPIGAATRTLIRTTNRLASVHTVDYAGDLFSTICISLASSCRLAEVRLAAAHWAPAIVEGRDRVQTPWRVLELRDLALRSLVEAGVRRRELKLLPISQEHRRAALHLAVHSFMRLLVAYALRCELAHDPGVIQFRKLLFPH
jgi:hypothetical protein